MPDADTRVRPARRRRLRGVRRGLPRREPRRAREARPVDRSLRIEHDEVAGVFERVMYCTTTTVRPFISRE